MASSSRPWGQHVGALIGLLTLGCPALLHSLTPIARSYHNRLAHAIAQAPSPSTRDALDAHTAKCLLLVGTGIVLMLHCPITVKECNTNTVWLIFKSMSWTGLLTRTFFQLSLPRNAPCILHLFLCPKLFPYFTSSERFTIINFGCHLAYLGKVSKCYLYCIRKIFWNQ